MKPGDDPSKCGILPQPRKTVRPPRVYLRLLRAEGRRR